MTIKQIERCSNMTVEIIYCSAQGEFSKRRVKVIEINEKSYMTDCLLTK
ncbi:hypothetical protein [Aquibacillus rhizosphaerae]|uniref:WYL domain-containing protein n=1 Tax=Aquibacillus rhizosphaerae TaxID=3051431 RepID=A0ABT7L1J1_9BACI|nr:hypothetical protein [Aquibacillus sp. LR5S19]MDL4839716.1 hypothetical protein [Aquibacillus sp. LR5S19]